MLHSLLILGHCVDQSSTVLLEDFKHDDYEIKETLKYYEDMIH